MAHAPVRGARRSAPARAGSPCSPLSRAFLTLPGGRLRPAFFTGGLGRFTAKRLLHFGRCVGGGLLRRLTKLLDALLEFALQLGVGHLVEKALCFGLQLL